MTQPTYRQQQEKTSDALNAAKGLLIALFLSGILWTLFALAVLR